MNTFLPKELTDSLNTEYQQIYHLRLEIKSVHPLGGGCINSACKIETKHGPLFLKWNTHGPSDLFIREAESLSEFSKSNNEHIIFPEPKLSRQIDHHPGYLLTTYLKPGRSGNDEEKLGRGLALLHSVHTDQFGFAHDNYCGATLQNNEYQPDWTTFYTENRIGFLISHIRKTRLWTSQDQRIADKFSIRVKDLLPHNPKPSLIHGDLWTGNCMYTQSAPALIDPCASYCDREFEIGMMTLFGGFSQRVFDAYHEVYPLAPEWKERNLIYQLYHVLNHYSLFGGFYKNQAIEIMSHYC
ncbi:MAG TPA: fructosamine kinase family protein [Prolixibacteraceae bacterium]|nr:fructosamine kinase family protein [Prolixibacteraceae bacterium]